MTYRVGSYQSLVEDFGYVVQRKTWYGWKTVAVYYNSSDAIEYGRELQDKGHEVKFYI